MNWLWPRVLAPLLLVGLGALGGYLFGRSTAWIAWWIAAGSIGGFLITIAWDTWRGQRVLRWLRDRPHEPAPIEAGLWGHTADRVQKALRQRDRSLRDEQAKLQQFLSAIDASPNGVTIIDQHDAIVWCNAMAADHFGIDMTRDHAQRITNLVRAPAFAEAMARQDHDPVMFSDPRGERRLTVSLRAYGQGMRLVLSQDITEADRSDTMRRHFVANVSHEIRTPLTVLAGSLETMMALPLEPAERDRMLGLMKQQADRMQTLVSDLLTLATLEGSPRPAPDRWVGLDQLFQQAQADAAALSAGRHALQFEVQPGTELAGNPNELTSLVGNLLSNAIRYTPDGGSISLAWQDTYQGTGELTVTDTGIGIATEHLPHLTERFYRVDGSRSRETGGTGLGLAIVKHVAQRHGAELMIASEPGKGSTFKVRFPKVRVRQAKQGSA